jgi:hypothetical protein
VAGQIKPDPALFRSLNYSRINPSIACSGTSSNDEHHCDVTAKTGVKTMDATRTPSGGTFAGTEEARREGGPVEDSAAA